MSTVYASSWQEFEFLKELFRALLDWEDRKAMLPLVIL